MKPLLRNVKSYIRDTVDFLNNLPTKVEKNTDLVTFDITSMYTNINNDLGIEAISHWLEEDPNAIPRRIPKEFILEGLKLVLESNTFFYNGRYYLQIRGVAMGQNVAPTFVTLVLAYLEKKLYKKLEDHYGLVNGQYIKQSWKRFLDDCCIPWKTSIGPVEEFCDILNSLDSGSEFTMKSSHESIDFLDVEVKIDKERRITTDIYHKPTDSFNYIPFDSGHPKHQKVNIPFNRARRIRTIVSDENRSEQRLQDLKTILQNKRYPEKLIKDGIWRAKNIPKEELRKTKRPQENKNINIAYVTSYNPNNPNILSTIRNTLPLLKQSPQMNKIVDKIKIINS